MLLLGVFFGEIYNSMVSLSEEGGMKEAIYEQNNIIKSNYALCTILPIQLKNISARQ